MGFGFIAVLLCGNMKRFDTVTSFRWSYEQKYRRNNRDISPQTIPSVSFLPRRDSTCPLTLLTDTDNYFFFIRGSLHVPSCLFVGFFLLFCGIWVLWWYGIFKRSTHEYEILFFFSFLNSESRQLHLTVLFNLIHRSRLQNLSPYLLNKFEMK